MSTLKKYWAEHQGKAIALIPKCGNTSISALIKTPRISIEDALKFEARVMFIRDPIAERFVSNYGFFKFLNDESPREDVPIEVTHNGYERFVDFALANPNPHWMPQMELTGSIATSIHKFNSENLRKWWGYYWPGRLPDWLNACTHLPTNDYSMDDLKLYYADDIIAYERAT